MFKIYNLIFSNLIILLFIIRRKFNKKNSRKYEIIIFSYNRPLQLNTLLKSLSKLFDPRIKINILYRTNSEIIKNCYKKLICNFKSKKINFIQQNGDFKKSLLDLLNKIKKETSEELDLLFFVDDQILFKKVKIESLNKLSKLAPISTLRIGLNTRWSYNLNKKQNLKAYKYKVEENCIYWYPKFIRDDISYIFSFDGSTIPLGLFANFSKYLHYRGPNSLETSMNYGDIIYKILKQKVSSFCEQRVVNVVISTVQNETTNRGRFININKLNDLFIKNWELKLDRKKIDTFDSPHIENGYILQKQNKIL